MQAGHHTNAHSLLDDALSIATTGRMVLLTVTPAAKAAIDQWQASKPIDADRKQDTLDHLQALEVGNPVEHEDLVTLSRHLRQYGREQSSESSAWTLDNLLRGARIHQPPPPLKAEPVSLICGRSSEASLTD